MAFRWDDFVLDTTGNLLTRKGRRVATSRKILTCIKHLIEQRQRAVTYQELSRVLYGHTDVTHNQLFQVINSARRALGDDGHAQRLILTMHGVGYRWIGEVETCDDDAAGIQPPSPQEDAEERMESARTEPELPVHGAADRQPFPAPNAHAQPGLASAGTPKALASRAVPLRRRIAIGSGLALAISLSVYGLFPPDGPLGSESRTAVSNAPIAKLEAALDRGEFDAVRAGLAALPANIANSPDARLLDIRIDARRHVRNAAEKMEIELARPEANEPLHRARLLLLKNSIDLNLGSPPEERLARAQSVIDILERLGPDAPPELLARAISSRAKAQQYTGNFDLALQDFDRAIQLLEQTGDEMAVSEMLSSRARLLMRLGRLPEALAVLEENAEYFRKTANRLSELSERNTITRIQMELMRWDDAVASSDRSMALLQAIPDTKRRFRTLQLRAQAQTAVGRLRIAASQLDEASASARKSKSHIIPAWHRLESGDYAGAMRKAEQAFSESEEGHDQNDVLLDGKEGALLIWTMAAQKSAESGTPMPAPTPEMRRRLDMPRTALGRIARGRWLWSQGSAGQAEFELRAALSKAREMKQFFRMTLATEPLVGILLERKDVIGAQRLTEHLRAVDPPRVQRDYRYNALCLHVALAKGDAARIEVARRNLIAVSGERPLPSLLASGLAEYGASVKVQAPLGRSWGAR